MQSFVVSEVCNSHWQLTAIDKHRITRRFETWITKISSSNGKCEVPPIRNSVDPGREESLDLVRYMSRCWDSENII